MRKFVVLAVVAAAIAAGVAGCKTLGSKAFAQPVVTFKDVKINGVGLNGGSLDIVLSVYNPNGYRLDATRLTYRLMVDSIPFGTGATDNHFVVQSKDSTFVRLPLDFSWSGIGTAGRQLLNTGAVNYRVLGDITVGTPVGPYTLNYDQKGRFSTLGGSAR